MKPLNQSDFPLTILEDLGMEFPSELSNQKKRFALFICPYCSNSFRSEVTSVKKLRATKCKSCSIRISKTVHGDKGTKLHNCWLGLRDRCFNPNNISWSNYGKRGITVCPEWDTYLIFKEWALANGFQENLSIDRIDNNKGYSPDNCRWVDRCTQSQNTRLLSISNTTGYRGVWPEYSKYCASITVNKITYRLGTFESPKEAAKAYDTFVLENNLIHPINGI